LRVTARTPPTFLWHGADDPVVPVQNSLLFAQALADHGVPHELHIYARGACHGVGLAAGIPRVEEWPRLCREWIQENFMR
jgi:acetyl esterase/lipase